MPDSPSAPPPTEPELRGFPFITVALTLATFFVFPGFMMFAYRSPNYLDETKTEPKTDPATKLSEVKARNQAVLDGNGAKMSVPAATSELLGKLKSETDRLPFPMPEPPAALAVEPKKMN